MVILKLDFEKAFDKVHNDFILQVLQAKGLELNGVLGLSSFLLLPLPLFC
jgi:hypothetical protein